MLVEMEDDVCQNVAAERLKRVIEGYSKTDGDKITRIEGLGGGFRYCRLGRCLFDENGNIAAEVTFRDVAAHVFFTETGAPIFKRATGRTPFLGIHQAKAVYLLFNGVMGDKRPNGRNVLTGKMLEDLPAHQGPKVLYGEGCRLSPQRLRREGIIFKQIPYEIFVDVDREPPEVVTVYRTGRIEKYRRQP